MAPGSPGYAAGVVAGSEIGSFRLTLPLALSRRVVDTAGERRTDEAWLATAHADPSSRYLVVDDGTFPVSEDRQSVRLLTAAELGRAPAPTDLFLGLDDAGAAFFAVFASADQPLPPEPVATLREVGALLDARDAGLATHAVALANWHATHTHCPRCGGPTVVINAGWVRLCPADGSQHFPRTDPAIIVLIVDALGRCLLGRQQSWPAGRFSTLAGFVEPGESLEQAVEREVFEEVGVRVTDMTYAGSQPWPFPASLMLGFYARAVSTEITVDGTEISEAAWFTVADYERELATGALLPPSGISIARRLIESWYGASVGADDR